MIERDNRMGLPDGIHQVKFGEFTRVELDSSSGIVGLAPGLERSGTERELTNREAIEVILGAYGAQNISFSSMNCYGSDASKQTNRVVTRKLETNPYMRDVDRESVERDRVYAGVALMPKKVIQPDYEIIR